MMPVPAAIAMLAVHVATTFLPGLTVGLALGLRSWLLVATSPLLTYAIIGIAGPALPLAGIRWSPWALVAVSGMVALAVLTARAAARRHRPGPPRAAAGTTAARWSPVHHAGVALAVVAAAGQGAALAYAATDGFSAVPQIWDAVFHANATHYIAETGRSDPAALGNLNGPVVAAFYYPNAYHVLVATVLMIGGGAVTSALDTHIALFPGLLALGVVALVRQSGGRPALAAAVALLSCAFTAFPYDLLPWGTLLPFIVALVLVPAFLALATTALRPPGSSGIATPVALGLAGVGLLALHPSGAVTAAVFGVALVLQLWLQRGPQLTDVRVAALAAVTVALAASPLLRGVLGAASGPPYDWPATSRPADAMGQLFFLSHEQTYPQYWLVGLVVLGLFRLAPLRPLWWFCCAGVVFAGLFTLSASYDGGSVETLTQMWWNDKWRLAAVWSLVSVLLAGAGLVALRDLTWIALRKAVPVVDRLRERPRVVVSGITFVVLSSLVAVLSNGLYFHRNEARMAQAFTDGPTVSSGERQAFDVLARIVPEGSMVMNDPYDGSALMWALAGVRPVFATPVIAPYELPTMDPRRRVLFESFDELDTNRVVQRAVHELDIRYAIIDAGLIVPAGEHVAGMQNLDRVQALELVYDSDDARIYAVNQVYRAEVE